MFRFNRGDTIEQCATEEKVSETTDFKDDVVQDDDQPVKDDDTSEADFAAQQSKSNLRRKPTI